MLSNVVFAKVCPNTTTMSNTDRDPQLFFLYDSQTICNITIHTRDNYDICIDTPNEPNRFYQRLRCTQRENILYSIRFFDN